MRQVKVSDDVYDKLKEIAEKQGGASLNDVIKALLNLYLGGSPERAIDKIASKEFVADSEKVCSRCRRKIEVGEVVYWVKYTYSDGSSTTRYFCFECANPTVAKVYKKKREMELVVKQLKKEADALVEEIKKLEQVKAVHQLKSEVIQLWRAFKQAFGENPDYKVVDQFLDKLSELVDRVSRLESAITVAVDVKRQVRKSEAREVYKL